MTTLCVISCFRRPWLPSAWFLVSVAHDYPLRDFFFPSPMTTLCVTSCFRRPWLPSAWFLVSVAHDYPLRDFLFPSPMTTLCVISCFRRPWLPSAWFLVSVANFRIEDKAYFNSLNAELNPICHLLALLRAHHIFHVSRIRVRALPQNTPRVLAACTIFRNVCSFLPTNWA